MSGRREANGDLADADGLAEPGLLDDKKDLEEPLSPKEPQEEAIPRKANY